MATSDDPGAVPSERELLCPEHHADLEDLAGPTVYCKRCGHAYREVELIEYPRTTSHY